MSNTIVYWVLSYRADVSGYPILDVMFSDEKYAISALKKFWGEEFDTLLFRENSSGTNKEWYKERPLGIRNMMATLHRIEVKPHARAIKLNGTRPEYKDNEAA